MDPEWVVIRSCTWLNEALFIKSVLESAGIRTLVPDEHTLSMQPLYGIALGGVRVLVSASNAERAEELLDSAARLDRPDQN